MSGQVALTASDVLFSYGGLPFELQFALSIARGEFLAIAGPNGSGKSTMLKLLAGLLRPQSGSVALDGSEVCAIAPATLAASVSYLPQFPSFPPSFSVIEAVMQGGYHRVRGSFFDPPQVLEAATNALKTAGILHLAQRQPETLSGGEFRRAAFARVLAQNAPLLLLDEPAASLDLKAGISLFSLMRTLTRKGRTACVTTHDLALALAFADRIFLVSGGRIVAAGSPYEIANAELVKRVFGIECEILDRGERKRPVILPNYDLLPANLEPDELSSGG